MNVSPAPVTRVTKTSGGGLRDNAFLAALAGRAAAICDQHPFRTPAQQSGGGIGRMGKLGLAEATGFFEVHIERAARVIDKGQQAFGLAG